MAFGTDASNRMGSPQAVGATFFNKTIDQSLRFEDGDNPYLRRTMTAGTDNKKFTFSLWIKRSKTTVREAIFSAGDGSTNSVELRFGSSDNLEYLDTNNSYLFITSAAYRDTSAWYHIVMRVDTTQSNEKHRARLYVNGEEVVNFSTDNRSQYALNEATTMNTAQPLDIGRWVSAQEYFDGYMAEVHYSDGYSYGPEYYGENKNGVWIPKQVSGVTYGTNGFYLDFLGADGGFSAQFSGGSDLITFTTPTNCDIGSSDDFCFEFWAQHDAASTYYYIAGYYATGGPHGAFQFSNGDVIYWYTGNGAAIGPYDYTAVKNPNAFQHYAVVRESGRYYVYVDGNDISSGGTTSGGTAAYDYSTFLFGDAHPTAGAPHFNGYISNFRLTVGSARYTGGNSFTPATSLTADSTNVKLLAFTNSDILDDASSFNHSGATTSGSPVFSSYGPAAGGLLSQDKSGNSNHFSMSGLAATDVLPDSPTNNFATFNPLDQSGTTLTYSEGNLKAERTSSSFAQAYSSLSFDSGKWYAEFIVDAGNLGIGVIAGTTNPGSNRYMGQDTYTYGYYSDGRKVNSGSYTTYGDSYSQAADGSGDVVGVYIDADNGDIYFSKNGTIQNSGTAAFTGITGPFRFAIASESNCFHIANFGQDDTFAGLKKSGSDSAKDASGRGTFYDAPALSGYKAACTANLTEPVLNPRNDSIENSFFYTTLYEGNGGGQRVGQFLPLNEVKTVNNAIRFNDGSSPELYKSWLQDATDRKHFTVSFWVKRGIVGSGQHTMLQCDTSGGQATQIVFKTDDTLTFNVAASGVAQRQLITNRKFRDTSRFYHIVCAYDSEATTAAERARIYVDGEELTDFSSDQRSNIAGTDVHGIMENGQSVNTIGFRDHSSVSKNFLDGYLCDYHCIDGQTLTPSYFGQTDPSTEKWIPKTYSGTYGNNGFHLEFLNTSNYGLDSAGTNNFTAANLAAADQVIDTPTKNFATLDNSYGVIGASALSEGNLKSDGAGFSSTLWGGGFASIPLPSTGKYYFECQDTAADGSNWGAGVCSEQATPSSTQVGGAESITFYNRSVYLNGTSNDYGSSAGFGGLGDATYAAGDIMGVAVDCSTREVWFSQNGTFIDTPTTNDSGTPGNPSAGTYPVGSVDPNDSEPMRFVLYGSASNMICNFGQDSSFAGQIAASANTDGSGGQFKFTPPTGFKALNVDNLPQRSQGIARRKIPALTWIKNRDQGDNHMLFDQVRGAEKDLHSSSTAAQVTDSNTLQKFLPGGFQVGNDVQVNTSGESYVAWNWCMHDSVIDAGAQSNSDGDVTSSVLADKKLGFSMGTFTKSSSGAQTVGHGLRQTPDMYVVKRYTGGTGSWFVYHKDQHDTAPEDNYVRLNTTNGATDDATIWNDTAPTSSVFTVGSGFNDTEELLFYAWHSIEGFSKIDGFEGNGDADGSFVHLGFKPAFVVLKTVDKAGGWHVFDNQRSNENRNDDIRIEWDNADAENNGSSNNLYIDFVSNGFKLRTSFDNMNHSGSMIYMAFAEQPFMFANAR